MPAASRPNIVLCVSDQLRAFELGCHGHASIRTPVLDQFAAESVRFEVACSNDPLCTPARAALLTGQYARTCMGMTGCCGDPTPERRRMIDTTLPEALRQVGYRTASIGKWHLPPRPDLIGFDRFVYPAVHHRHRGRRYSDNTGRDFIVPQWTWDYDMDQVRQFLDDAGGRSDPFFLYFNIEPPHMPLDDAPDHYRRMYDPATIPLRDNVWVDGRLARDEHWFRTYLWDSRYYRDHEPHTRDLPEGFDLRTLTAMYAGLVTLVDDQVGKLLALLDAQGLRDDTLLIFTSDHGDNLGSHHLWNKCELYDESIRIPMMYRWPGRLDPRVVSTQVTSLVDVMPTLLTLVDAPIPPGVQGTDVTPVLGGLTDTTGANAAYIETIRGGPGVRTCRHTYGIALRDVSLYRHEPEGDEVTNDRLMFFDNHTDPYQQHSLAGGDAQSSTADRLREQLLDWHARTPWLAQQAVAT